MLLAAGAGACLALLPHASPGAGRAALELGAALLIQLRLASNLLDGLVAVEAGRGTRTGPLYNEVPDRVADLLILVPAGYAVTGVAWGPELGWAAGSLAVLTAYIRLLGGSLGQPQRYCGPLAKPHRMFVLTLGCLASLAEIGADSWRGVALAVALVVVAAGSALTCAARLRAVAAALPPVPDGRA
jgi:phosphatidylglycerophosphate synthase